jgi:hypothetical protein
VVASRSTRTPESFRGGLYVHPPCLPLQYWIYPKYLTFQ